MLPNLDMPMMFQHLYSFSAGFLFPFHDLPRTLMLTDAENFNLYFQSHQSQPFMQLTLRQKSNFVHELNRNQKVNYLNSDFDLNIAKNEKRHLLIQIQLMDKNCVLPQCVAYEHFYDITHCELSLNWVVLDGIVVT